MDDQRDLELAALDRTLSTKRDEHVPALAWKPESAAREKALICKVYWGLLPWMFLTGIFTYFDRANFSFASPALKQDLGLANSGYGLASGENLQCSVLLLSCWVQQYHLQGDADDVLYLLQAFCLQAMQHSLFPATL
jgi:hypothetical protein